jgi:hypothetical protein
MGGWWGGKNVFNNDGNSDGDPDSDRLDLSPLAFVLSPRLFKKLTSLSL